MAVTLLDAEKNLTDSYVSMHMCSLVHSLNT